MRLEAIILPVSDVDRAKEFYLRAGFVLDVDDQPNDDIRVVQFTPPGSPCSILFGTGMSTSDPGSVQGLHLVVTDVETARAELVERGVEVAPVFHYGPQGPTDGPDPEHHNFATYATFADPDGNGWLLQERDHPDRTA